MYDAWCSFCCFFVHKFVLLVVKTVWSDDIQEKQNPLTPTSTPPNPKARVLYFIFYFCHLCEIKPTNTGLDKITLNELS